MSGSTWSLKTSIEIQIFLKIITVEKVETNNFTIFFYHNIATISVELSIPRSRRRKS